MQKWLPREGILRGHTGQKDDSILTGAQQKLNALLREHKLENGIDDFCSFLLNFIFLGMADKDNKLQKMKPWIRGEYFHLEQKPEY